MSNMASSPPPKPTKRVILNDADLIRALGLDWTVEQTEAYLEAKVPKYYVSRLDRNEMPVAPKVWYAESDEVKKEWEEFWKDAPYADSRINKKAGRKTARKIEVLDRSKFKHVLRRGEYGRFYDDKTKELVFVRLPNIVESKEVLEMINHVCKRAVRERRGDRRDDPGIFVNVGYTSSQRNKRKNVLAGGLLANLSPEEKARVHMEEAGMGAMAWNIIKSRIPDEVIKDFDDAIAQKGLSRMDGGFTEGLFSLFTKDQGYEYRFSNLEAGPPRGGCAMNYTRFCHNESGQNIYGIALTTVCTALPHRGGNFYVAQYGILMEAEKNTVSCWRVNDYHGTSLYERSPRQNCGIAFFVPKFQQPDTAESKLPFTFEEIANVDRKAYERKETGRISKETRNEYCLRDQSPETETEDSEVEGDEEKEKLGEDGSNAVERSLLETQGWNLAEQWEDEAHVDGTEEAAESDDKAGDECERPVAKRQKREHE